jgi:adenylate cyclase
MAENSDHRKLTAILCADVKGYSRLMGEDESYTVGALKECRKVFAENIQKHAGRVVNAPGDSILAEFPSVVSAIQCAVEIQNQLDDRNADLPDNRKMVFRIGVNLGDVIQSEDAIYGDGVNIAARIEALAEPGGVSISRTVFNQVRNKLPFGYEYQGEHQVKNITNPVKVFKLLTASEDAGKLVGMEPIVSASKWIWPTAVVAAVIVALIGYHVYQEIAGSKFEPASVEKMAYDLPDKPSIAVLPFDNLSGDPQQEYICDGLSEQIITSLSKVSGLFVIARNSSFSFKGKAVKVQQVAEQLGVRYVLEGSLQKSGDKVRITAQLIDAITGHHLWAETYDRELQDIFALQDEITIKILGSVGAELTTGERARVYAKGTNNLEAYIKVSKGYEHFERQGKEENILARKFAKEAIDLDPNYPSAWCLLGGTYLMDPFVGSTDSANPWNEAIKVFQKALELDETHAPSNGALAFVYGCQRKYEKAFEQAQRGIELNPGTPISQMGFVLAMVGRYEEAVQYLKKAIRYDPKAPTFYHLGLGHAYRGLKRYENAIAAYNKALERDPDYFMAHLYLTGTYYMAGQEEEARAEAAEVLRLQPKFSVNKFAKALPYQDQDYRDRLVEGMLKAGLPE